ncbi:MAG: hypothetical protein ACOYZ8_13015 [Chloroflexota bacterium]
MNGKVNFSFEAATCLLAQGGIQPPLRTLATGIANAARLLVETAQGRMWMVKYNT